MVVGCCVIFYQCFDFGVVGDVVVNEDGFVICLVDCFDCVFVVGVVQVGDYYFDFGGGEGQCGSVVDVCCIVSDQCDLVGKKFVYLLFFGKLFFVNCDGIGLCQFSQGWCKVQYYQGIGGWVIQFVDKIDGGELLVQMIGYFCICFCLLLVLVLVIFRGLFFDI